MKIGIAVMCSECGLQKKPHGRSASDMIHYCDESCAGYLTEPKPGCMWPGETEKEFGFNICHNATEDVSVCDCGHPHSEHHTAWACGLECFACSICGCPEYSGPTPESYMVEGK